MKQVKDPAAVRRNIDSSVHTPLGHEHTTLTHTHTHTHKHTSTGLNLLRVLWAAAKRSKNGLEEFNTM